MTSVRSRHAAGGQSGLALLLAVLALSASLFLWSQTHAGTAIAPPGAGSTGARTAPHD